MGSFVIPMGQYFWYVREDSSFDAYVDKKIKSDVGSRSKAAAAKPAKAKGGWGRKAKVQEPPPVEKKKNFWER